jgi:hypothetical protein
VIDGKLGELEYATGFGLIVAIPNGDQISCLDCHRPMPMRSPDCFPFPFPWVAIRGNGKRLVEMTTAGDMKAINGVCVPDNGKLNQ